MSKSSRTKLKSGTRKLKEQGRGPVPSSAERRKKAAEQPGVSFKVKGNLPKDPKSQDQGENRGNKGASNRGDKPSQKFANAQNHSKKSTSKKAGASVRASSQGIRRGKGQPTAAQGITAH